jgi:hypothetical protein
MAAEKKKLEKFTSPEGVAGFPWLNKPDTKFKPEGEYKTTLVMDEDEAKPMIERIEALIEAQLVTAQEEVASNPKLKASLLKANKMDKKTGELVITRPYAEKLDDQGNPTGKIEFTFKMKASFKTKKGEVIEQHPQLFDAAGKELNRAKTPVRGGSVLSIAGEYVPYFTTAAGVGVSLRMKAVQILKLVSSGGTAEGFGFGTRVGGYTAEPVEEEAADTADTAGKPDASDNEDF